MSSSPAPSRDTSRPSRVCRVWKGGKTQGKQRPGGQCGQPEQVRWLEVARTWAGGRM